MNVAITGAGGFIGRHLAARLRAAGHSVRAISLRTPPRGEDLAGCDAVVNLAGESIGQRWTAAAKQRIVESRVNGTRALFAAFQNARPNVLVSASAVGFYGSRGDDILTEREPPADDFLGQVCVAWEKEAREAEKFGVRVVPLRFGMVLGADGGALERILKPFRLGLGGRLGNGRQWIS